MRKEKEGLFCYSVRFVMELWSFSSFLYAKWSVNLWFRPPKDYLPSPVYSTEWMSKINVWMFVKFHLYLMRDKVHHVSERPEDADSKTW